jgi:hypothetical protein
VSSFELDRARGDTVKLLVTATRDDSPIDISTSTVYFTAKTSRDLADDATGVIQKVSSAGIEVLDGPSGQALVTIDPEDTEALVQKTKYFCDVQLVEADGTVTTIAEGTLVMHLDVTRIS